VAAVESGLVQELYLERRDVISYVGNIYMGRVERVLPGMQAAFIHIGLARTAFLHIADLLPRNVDELTEEGVEGQAVTEAKPMPAISDLLNHGQTLPVQVMKDPLGSKGARLTTQLSIPSRYLVLLPTSTHIGVSVRIEDEAERERLKQMIETLIGPEPTMGFIIRTNAEGVAQDALKSDLEYLLKRWERVVQDQKTAAETQCIYEDLSLPYRTLRDLMHARIDKVRIDDASTYEGAVSFAKEFFSDWVGRIEHYTAARPLFDLYGVES